MARSRIVIAPTWIGDSVMAIPLVRALRRAYPEDRLSVLARRGPAAVFRAEGSAHLVLTQSGLLADVLALRRARFDEAWLLPNSFRAALIASLAGVRERIGYATDRRGPLLTHPLPAPRPVRHQLRDYDALLSSRGIEPDLGPPRFAVPHAAAQRATQALAEAGIPPDRPLALLAPGAAFGWTKRWSAERFGHLADRLAEKGFACAVVIGPEEEDLAVRVKAAARGRLPTLGADLDPAELAGALARAHLLVSNDSGPMHLASAVGTPVLAFFGPTDPGRTAPVGSASRILDRYVFCSPCYLKACPYGHECMREI
ncbi:MAG: lipopolysaccharide heptosyltransferase II, partial [Thermoanaerobaculia bacterium]